MNDCGIEQYAINYPIRQVLQPIFAKAVEERYLKLGRSAGKDIRIGCKPCPVCKKIITHRQVYDEKQKRWKFMRTLPACAPVFEPPLDTVFIFQEQIYGDAIKKCILCART